VSGRGAGPAVGGLARLRSTSALVFVDDAIALLLALAAPGVEARTVQTALVVATTAWAALGASRAVAAVHGVCALGTLVLLRPPGGSLWDLGAALLVVVAAGAVARQARNVWEGRHVDALNLADRDAATGLLNRRGLDAWVQAALPPGSWAIIAVVDVDDLKGLNDARGHDAGDRAISAVAARLAAEQRVGQRAARLGGDEFALVVGTSLPAERLQALGDRLLRGLRESLAAHGATVSVGLAQARLAGGASDVSALFTQSDSGLYAAKSAGGDRCAVAPPPSRPPT